jgi:GntR family transcriptional repressor for pyruvate dehydrogenase complex
VHDIRFHRAVAAACGNPILASVVEMVSGMFYEQRRRTASRARDRRPAAEMHRQIYQAIRDRDRGRAEELMAEHLRTSELEQESEGPEPARPAALRAAAAAQQRAAVR